MPRPGFFIALVALYKWELVMIEEPVHEVCAQMDDVVHHDVYAEVHHVVCDSVVVFELHNFCPVFAREVWNSYEEREEDESCEDQAVAFALISLLFFDDQLDAAGLVP
jgi:hypothetical protein